MAIVGVVAAVAIAVAAPYLAPIALGALGIAATTTAVAIATAVISLTLSIGLSLAFRALGVGAPSAKSQVGPPQVFRQSITDSFIIYGLRRAGGLLAFFHGEQASSGAHFRYFVIAVAGHRCQGAVNYRLGDEIVTVDPTTHKVTSGQYANACWLQFDRGDGTLCDLHHTFVAECGGKWTDAHVGNDIAKLFAKFQLTDGVVQAGMPNMTVDVEGRDEIRDPRTGTTGYSRNASMVFYDWLQMAREDGGFGAYTDEMPDDTWQSAQANVCDETVNGNPRYCIDAVLTTGAAPGEVRDAMVVNQAGSYTYSGGSHLMRPGYWNPVSATLAEDDLAGPIQVSPFDTSDATANQVQGTYISAPDGYQGMPFTTWTAPDVVDISQLDLDLAFVTNKDQADRVAAIMGRRAQCEKSVVWPMNIMGLGIKALDTVQVDKPDYGLNNYAWNVVNWGLSADFGVVATLREENEDIYSDGAPVALVTPPTISVPPPMLTLDQTRLILQQVYLVGNVDALDAGSDATIRIYGATTTDNFTLQYPDSHGAVSQAPQNITGLAYSTLYYPYCDVDPATLLPNTFGATTVYLDSLNSADNPYRITMGRSITTPAAGGATTGGGATGGGYGGGGTAGDGGHVASV